MKAYPLYVPRSSYRGSDPAKRRRAAEYSADAARLEEYLNARIKSNPNEVQQYFYGVIAPDVGMSEDRVREVLYRVDCGHNGLTVSKDPAGLS
jgi:hypothetical protein